MNSLPINTTISLININPININPININLININLINTINTIQIKGTLQCKTRASHQAMAKTCPLPHFIKCLLKFKTIVTFLKNSAQIIIIQEQLNIPCQMCGATDSFARRSPGCAAFSWCVCLFCFTGIFCFWVPFVIDRCYDVEIVCPRCLFVKSVVEAPCC